MIEIPLAVGMKIALQKSKLEDLITNLQQMGYQTIGPRVRDNTITYEPVARLSDLPHGYVSDQEAAHYQLTYTGNDRYFDAMPGPHTWKQFLFPPITQLLTFERDSVGNWKVQSKESDAPSYAFIGMRPCELAAILVQDRVFFRENWQDPLYRRRRQSAFILAVNCLHPAKTCFCASMGTGPEAESGFDLCLTELDDVFMVEIGSEAGRMALSNLPLQPATAFWLKAAENALEEARRKMGRSIPNPLEVPDLLLNNLEARQWDNVASRCMSCASCTQVCPTCFCWDVKDKSDLSGNVALRERVWDSCFNPDYSYVFGGNTRPNTRARYRQWLTHKFASWYAQFGVLGCVGCGRCITWCPAGIDVTAEIAAIRQEVQS